MVFNVANTPFDIFHQDYRLAIFIFIINVRLPSNECITAPDFRSVRINFLLSHFIFKGPYLEDVFFSIMVSFNLRVVYFKYQTNS